MKLLGLLLFLTTSHCALQYVSVKKGSNCQAYIEEGSATCCCDGLCTDGSRQQDSTFSQPCKDQPINCGSNQVWVWFSQDPYTHKNVPPGICYATCSWQKYEYRFKCCDCPPGFKSTSASPNCDTYGECVGCTGGTEVLTGTNIDGYECTPVCTGTDPPPACKKKCGRSKEGPLCEVVGKNTDCPTGGCKINSQGLSMLKSYEQMCPSLYDAGDGDQTIGWGHDCTQAGDCSTYKGQNLTMDQGNELLNTDMARILQQSGIGSWPHIGYLTSNQFSALLSFGFQAGPGNLRKYFKEMVSNNSTDQICSTLASASIGPRDRRQAESQLCSTPTTVMSGC